MDCRINVSTTSAGINAYYANKPMLGEIVRAKMLGDKRKAAYELTLFDDFGSTLTIVSGLTSGYWGEGPSGTLEVLEDAGFQVGRSFIEEHISFDIYKETRV